MSRLLRAVTATALVISVLNGCDRGPSRVVLPPTPSVERTYVAVGASESVGFGADDALRDAWTQRLFHDAFESGTELYNLAIPGATVRSALTQQASEAVRLEPDVVTVWLNVNDLIAGEAADSYEQLLGELVHQLRRGGNTTVLVANTPPLERLPAYRNYLACDAAFRSSLAEASALRQPSPPQPGQPRPQVQAGPGPSSPMWSCSGPFRSTNPVPQPDDVVSAVAAYNAAIARVVEGEGAVLVDLHADAMKARDEGVHEELVGADGFHPSTRGHARVAEAFAIALRSVEPA